MGRCFWLLSLCLAGLVIVSVCGEVFDLAGKQKYEWQLLEKGQTGRYYAQYRDYLNQKQVGATRNTFEWHLPGIGSSSYLCVLPLPKAAASDDQEAVIEYPVENYLRPLEDECLFMVDGWWAYEFCYGRHVRQFHQETNGQITAEYYLGKQRDPSFTSRFDGNRYLELYSGGTTCDLTNKDRVTTVVYQCTMSGKSSITAIKEPSTCAYQLLVETPLLCQHPKFASRLKDAHQNTILCFEEPVPGEEEIESKLKEIPGADKTVIPAVAKVDDIIASLDLLAKKDLIRHDQTKQSILNRIRVLSFAGEIPSSVVQVLLHDILTGGRSVADVVTKARVMQELDRFRRGDEPYSSMTAKPDIPAPSPSQLPTPTHIRNQQLLKQQQLQDQVQAQQPTPPPHKSKGTPPAPGTAVDDAAAKRVQLSELREILRRYDIDLSGLATSDIEYLLPLRHEIDRLDQVLVTYALFLEDLTMDEIKFLLPRRDKLLRLEEQLARYEIHLEDLVIEEIIELLKSEDAEGKFHFSVHELEEKMYSGSGYKTSVVYLEGETDADLRRHLGEVLEQYGLHLSDIDEETIQAMIEARALDIVIPTAEASLDADEDEDNNSNLIK